MVKLQLKLDYARAVIALVRMDDLVVPSQSRN